MIVGATTLAIGMEGPQGRKVWRHVSWQEVADAKLDTRRAIREAWARA